MDIINANDSAALVVSKRVNLTLFDLNFSMALFYVTLVLILAILGIFGNSFIIYVMKHEKHMNKDARAFIINLAVADLCVSGIADPMCIAGAFLGMDYLNGEAWFCVAIASLCLTACICVFLNVVCLTVNRWVFICHDKIYDKIYNTTTTTLLCISTWVFGFGAEVPNFFGLGGHYFDEKSHQCIWDRTASRGYTLFVTLGLITSPFGILAYCNTAVLLKIRSVRQNVLKFSTGTTSTLKSSMSSAKILVTIFVVFLVCWTPYVVVLVADRDDAFSFEVHLFTTLLAHSHSSTSCIIYLAYKKKFREQLKGLFKPRNRIQPIVSSTTDKTKPITDKTVSTHA